MEKLLRTFIAVKINPENELLDQLAALKEDLGDEAIKWVEENNLHLTLRFFGDTTADQVAKIKSILDDVAQNHGSFKIELKGLGFFKRNRQPQVLFAKIVDVEKLRLLAGEIEDRIGEAGLEKETRKFKAHLTLARIKFLRNTAGFYDSISRSENLKIQSSIIDEVIFYQSILRPQGPVYKPLKIVKLH